MRGTCLASNSSPCLMVSVRPLILLPSVCWNYVNHQTNPHGSGPIRCAANGGGGTCLGALCLLTRMLLAGSCFEWVGTSNFFVHFIYAI